MDLIEKIKSRTACIGIIGLGYVGLPLVIRYCEEGFRVTGFDIDLKKVEKLNRGESYEMPKFINRQIFYFLFL